MIVYVGAVGVLALAGGKIRFRGIFPQYLSKQSSNAMKGIFILLIFASHFWPNIGWPTNQLDAIYETECMLLHGGCGTVDILYNSAQVLVQSKYICNYYAAFCTVCNCCHYEVSNQQSFLGVLWRTFAGIVFTP